MKIVELNEICDLQNGYAFKSSDYIESSNTLNCRMSNIRPEGYFDVEYAPKYLPDSFVSKYKEYLLKDGDLVIAMTDMANDPKILGVPTIVDTGGKSMLLNQRVGKLKVIRPDLIHVPYLQYSLNRKSVKKYYTKFAGGGVQLNVGKKQILSVKIPLPPLPQQKKIAAILDAADAYRSKTKALIAKYDELSQSLFLDMFGDPVSNPKGWEIVKFSDVGKLDRGKSKHRPRNAPELLGGNHPLIQTGDLANCGVFLKEFHSTYSDVGLKQSKKWLAGTLCITIAANIAKTGILSFDACFPDSIVGFLPNNKTNNIYTLFWLSFLQKILEETAPESAQKNINLAILRALDFPLPSIHLQNQFAERIQAIEAQKAQSQASLAKAEDLFNSLLQRAFKGELV